MYRRLRLCSGHGGYEAVAEPRVSLDLARAKALLDDEGIPTVDARVMLIVSMEPEVTISRAGRLLFKTGDVQAAQRGFERLQRLLDLPAMEPERPDPPAVPG